MYYNIYVYNLEGRARTPPLDLSILYYSSRYSRCTITEMNTQRAYPYYWVCYLINNCIHYRKMMGVIIANLIYKGSWIFPLLSRLPSYHHVHCRTTPLDAMHFRYPTRWLEPMYLGSNVSGTPRTSCQRCIPTSWQCFRANIWNSTENYGTS